jgi:hypothetical protein
MSRAFGRWTGACLVGAGLLTFLINALLTPLLPHEGVYTSPIFLWRQSASALAAGLLMFGAIGVHLQQSRRAGAFGAVAFAVALVGSALLLAEEWNGIFLMRDLARRVPDAIVRLDAGPGLKLYDLGSLIPLTAFVGGWIALAASTIRTQALSRRAAGLVIAGFFAIPLLSALLPGVWGGVIGNAILGGGLAWLGLDLVKASRL